MAQPAVNNHSSMQIKLLNNLEASKLVGVSHPTIAKWIQDTLQGKNDLELSNTNGRHYIIENEHNKIILAKLKEESLKYRNKTFFEEVEPKPEFYQTFTESQIIELIYNLEYNKYIPLKFTYLDKGAHIWDEYTNNLYKPENKEIYGLSLLDTNLSHISNLFSQPENLNILDIGLGNGYIAKSIIENLGHTKVSYKGLDISSQMLKIAEKNILKWIPDISTSFEEIDIEHAILRDDLFKNKIRHRNSINLILFLGSTYGNLPNRLEVLSNLYNSMNEGDYLLLDNGIDTEEWRSNFNSVNTPLMFEKFSWIQDCMNINREYYSRKSFYDEISKMRKQKVTFNKDVRVKLRVASREKNIDICSGDEILVWHHYSHKLEEFQDELKAANFIILHESCNYEMDHILTLCKKGSPVQIGSKKPLFL